MGSIQFYIPKSKYLACSSSSYFDYTYTSTSSFYFDSAPSNFFPFLFSYLFLVWSFLITLNINGDFCWDLLCFLLLSNGVAIGSSTSSYLLLALLSCPRTVKMVHAITSAIASLLARYSWSVELEHYEALQLRIYRYSYEL